MPHMHHCAVCLVPVAMCSDDSCLSDESHPNAPGHHDGGGDPEKAKQHYCTIHHPDPTHFVPPTPPLKK